MTEKPVAVLFDFNGTIVDDEPVHHQAYLEVLAGTGLDVPAERYFAEYLGLNDWALFARIHQDHGREASPARIDELVRLKAQAYARRLPGVRLVPGARELVLETAAHVPVAIVSGALRSEIQALLELHGLREAVRAIVAAEDVARSKPDPEGYLLGLHLLGSPAAQRCLAFEDAPHGIHAAQAAGLECWAVTTSRPAAHLQGAERVLESLEGLSFHTLQVADPR